MAIIESERTDEGDAVWQVNMSYLGAAIPCAAADGADALRECHTGNFAAVGKSITRDTSRAAFYCQFPDDIVRSGMDDPVVPIENSFAPMALLVIKSGRFKSAATDFTNALRDVQLGQVGTVFKR